MNVYLVKKIIKKDWWRDLKDRFKNTSKFSNDINKAILLLRKDVYPYEFRNDWEKSNEISLPEKEQFYSNLNMEYITDILQSRNKNL